MKNYLLTQKKKSLVFSYLAFFFFLFTMNGFSQGNTCATATSLTINGACDSGTITTDPNTAICGGTTWRRVGYYSFTVTGGPLNITVTAQSNARNLVMGLFSGSCASLTNINCADADSTNGVQTETITATLNNGTYYIAVGNTRNNDLTLNSVCVTSSAPPSTNFTCATATNLPCGTTNLAGTTVGSTGSPAHGTGCTMSNYGAWYTFVGDGQITTITTNPSFDIKLSIATGSCGSLTNIVCTDSSPESATFSTTLGTTYYVYIAHWSSTGTTTGTFTISRSCSTPIGNDNCAGAVSVPVNPTRTCTATTAGTIFGASDSGVTGSTCGGTDDDDVWYSFVATASTHYIELLNVAGNTTDLYHAVYSGSCGSLGAAIVCSDPDTSTVTGLTPGNTYYIQIYSWTSTSGRDTTFDVCVSTDPPCSGTPTAGTATTNPSIGNPGSNYTVSATGYPTNVTGLTFQWQYSTNGGSTWTNAGSSTTSYSNYTATAPALGTTVLWHLVVTCTNSGLSGTSSNGSFTSTNTINVPATGSNSVLCGTNIGLYDSGGPSGNYAYSSSGYTVLEAGVGATININGSYDTESSYDYINIYSGVGTGGTLLASYDGSGTINYTGTAGQTLTIQFTSDSITNYSGFSLSVTYSGACYTACSGTPTGGTVVTNPNTGWPGSSYTVSATGMTLALDMTYQWQFSTDAGATWTNAGAATTSYTNYTATAPASGDVHWQLIVTCTNSGQSATSVTGVFVTMEVSDVVTGCPNVVSGGFGLNGADPAPINCTSASTCVDLEATYLDLGNTSSYIVEPIVYNPPFAFNGLANPVSVNTDDVWSPTINLPFDFCFYGNTYNQCTIGSNGILTFDISHAGTSSGYSFSDNIPISGHSQLVENAIFGVFHDINPGISGEVGWELITLPSGCRALVASWYNVPLFGDNTQFYTGMMVLYENSNIIEVYINNKPNDPDDWNGNNAIVGIQNSTGTLASVAPGRNGLDPDWTATNEAWRFVPNGTSITTIQWYEGSGTSGPVVGTTDVITVCPGATTTYTAEITYTLCDGTTIVETDETTVTVNGAKTWDGSVNTNWNNANNWTPVGVPTIADCVLIPVTANDPIISGASYQAYGLNLTIDNGATLTINSNNSLTIDSWINIATGGDLVIQNAASLVQINNNTNTGIIHMDRDAVTTSPYDYVYWSSPVDNFSVDAITPTSLYKYQWIPTVNNSGAYAGNFGNWSAASGAMNVGQGYIVRGSSGISTFEGVPNNGIINTPIERSTYAGADYPGPTTTMVTENDDNWNLLGNPYPSAIDAIDFMATNTNIDGFVKIWTHGTLPGSAIADPFYDSYVYNYTPSDYITFNSSGTSSGPGVFGGYIAAGQGFFVLMNHTSASTSETVTFDNSMRSDTFDNSQFFKSSNTVEKNRIWLDLIDANNKNVRALVGYITDATNERDRLFDAITDKKLNFNLYSFTNSEKMTIQGRTLPFNVYDLVPMGVAVPADGNYKIAIGALDGLFENNNQEIYIEDLENGIIHNLRETPYNFTATKGNTDNRFVLRYTNNSLSNEDFSNGNTVSVYSNDNLIISSSLLDIKSVRIYDILGRSLANFESVDNKILTATGIQKNNNAIIVQITLTNGNVINKKVIY